MSIVRGLMFTAINVLIVRGYCNAMAGKLEPLKHEPERFVMVPLMVITAIVSVFLYPLLLRQSSRLNRGLMLYLGFVLISALYGLYLWNLFPDGTPFGVLLTVIGGHLYGAPVFLLVLLVQLLLGRVLLPVPKDGVG